MRGIILGWMLDKQGYFCFTTIPIGNMRERVWNNLNTKQKRVTKNKLQRIQKYQCKQLHHKFLEYIIIIDVLT
jgi:hypothetical protein